MARFIFQNHFSFSSHIYKKGGLVSATGHIIHLRLGFGEERYANRQHYGLASCWLWVMLVASYLSCTHVVESGKLIAG